MNRWIDEWMKVEEMINIPFLSSVSNCVTWLREEHQLLPCSEDSWFDPTNWIKKKDRINSQWKLLYSSNVVVVVAATKVVVLWFLSLLLLLLLLLLGCCCCCCCWAAVVVVALVAAVVAVVVAAAAVAAVVNAVACCCLFWCAVVPLYSYLHIKLGHSFLPVIKLSHWSDVISFFPHL